MPKRKGFLYNKMKNKEYIEKCINLGVKNKKHRRDVRKVIDNKEEYIDKIYDMVVNYNYTPTPPKRKVIIDKSSQKTRELEVQPCYPDGIMNQLVVEDILGPMIKARLHHSVCASVRKRGGAKMLKYNKKWIQKHPKLAKYAVELDVKKFYPSVPLKIVILALRRMIKDEKFLQLIAVIISFYPKGLKYAVDNNISPEEIVGDKVGLSIGACINQWLGNYILAVVDRLACDCDGVKKESRYMDNIVLLGNNKRKLHKAVKILELFLSRVLKLSFNKSKQLFKIAITIKNTTKNHIKTIGRRVSTVGFKIDHECILIRDKNFLKLRRQSLRIQKAIAKGTYISLKCARGFLSRIGQLKHCSGYNIRVAYVDPIGVRLLKNIIRKRSAVT